VIIHSLRTHPQDIIPLTVIAARYFARQIAAPRTFLGGSQTQYGANIGPEVPSSVPFNPPSQFVNPHHHPTPFQSHSTFHFHPPSLPVQFNAQIDTQFVDPNQPPPAQFGQHNPPGNFAAAVPPSFITPLLSHAPSQQSARNKFLFSTGMDKRHPSSFQQLEKVTPPPGMHAGEPG
jgi:hypothetical protein